MNANEFPFEIWVFYDIMKEYIYIDVFSKLNVIYSILICKISSIENILISCLIQITM